MMTKLMGLSLTEWKGGNALHLQENGRSQSSLEKREWDGPCSERLVGQLLQDLKGWGVDLESFQPKDLFETIRGRTLWCALVWHLVT